MLKHKILASNIIYVSISHNDKILDYYFKKLEGVFKKISKLPLKKLKVMKIENQRVSYFKRLN